MKQYSKKEIFTSVLAYLLMFVSFLSSIILVSNIDKNAYWNEAYTVSEHLYKENRNHTIYVSKSEDYPDFHYEIVRELSTVLTQYYVHNQKAFVCAYPDENIRPIRLNDLDESINQPFITLNSYALGRDHYATDFGNLMFGNEIKSYSILYYQIYITKHTADLLLNIDNPTREEYETLINKKIDVTITKNGEATVQKYEILDIIEKPHFTWLEELYGLDYIIGSYRASSNYTMDNYAVHIVMENDVISNSYMLYKADDVIHTKGKYISSYCKVQNGLLVEDEKLNNLIGYRESNNLVSKIVVSVISGILIISSIIGAIILIKNNKTLIIHNQLTPLFVSISYSFALLVATYLSTIIYKLPFISISPLGFIISLLLLYFPTLIIFLIIRQKKINKGK